MKRKILLLICLILFIVSIAGVSASEDANQTITDDDALSVSQSDGEILGSADNGTFTDLQKKIDDANESDVVNLENDYKYDSSVDSGEITINKTLTINGNGHTIDGNKEVRIFNVVSDNVVLNNISFINAYMRSWGGAIRSEYGFILNVYNCSFVHCDAYHGAAIYASSLNIYGCSFVNCSDYYYSYGHGGVIYTASGSIYVYDSSFLGYCRAIYSDYDDYGKIVVYDSSFVKNYNSISAYNKVIVHNSTFKDNDYAIYSTSGLDIYDSTFVNNNQKGFIGSKGVINVVNTTFINNPKFDVDISVDKKVFYSNVDSNINIYVNPNPYILNLTGYVTVNFNGREEKINLINGVATFSFGYLAAGDYTLDIKYDGDDFYGGYSSIRIKIVNPDYYSFKDLQELVNAANDNDTIELSNNYIYGLNSEDKTIEINKCIAINGNNYTIDGNNEIRIFNIDSEDVVLNNINFIGGDVFGFDSVINCSFVNSRAISDEGSFVDCTFVDCYTAWYGGAISIDSGSVVNCSFVGCSVDGYYGGAIYSYGSLNVSGCSFVNCSVEENGGAISMNSGSVVNCSFVGCSADSDYGGAIDMDSGSVVNCSFVGCSVGGYYGGAIYSYGSLNVSDCSFVDCSAGDKNAHDDGAVYSRNGDLKIFNTTFINCSPDDYYPADAYIENTTISSHININLDKTVVYVSDSIQIDITLDEGATGQVIVSVGDINETLNLTNSSAYLIESNLAVGIYDVVVRYLGDDIYSYGKKSSSFKVVDSTFKDLQELINNLTDGDVLNLEKNYTYVKSRDSSISINKKNITINGNGYTIDGNNEVKILYVVSDNVVLNNISFINGNSGNDYFYSRGGAITGSDSLIVVNCSFVGCSGNQGGAISGVGSVINCSFVGCSARGAGAISGVGSVINSTFMNCHADMGVGGAIFGVGSVVNSTFVDCYTTLNDGGAIYNSGNLNVSGSTFINNAASSYYIYHGGAIYCTDGVVICDDDSIFEGNSPDNIYNVLIPNNLIIALNSTVIYENASIKVDISFNNEILGVLKDISGIINVSIGGNEQNITLIDGAASFVLSNFSVGDYELSVSHGKKSYSYIELPNRYAYSTNSTTFTVVDSSYLSFTDLQELIDNATGKVGNGLLGANNEIPTVDLNNNYVYGLNPNDKTIIIDESIIINGNGYNLLGNNMADMIIVNAENVVLNNLTFTNTTNCVINSSAKSTTVKSSLFKDNENYLIWFAGDDSLVDYSLFVDNDAKSGSLIYIAGNNSEISNSVFEDNDGELLSASDDVEVILENNIGLYDNITLVIDAPSYIEVGNVLYIDLYLNYDLSGNASVIVGSDEYIVKFTQGYANLSVTDLKLGDYDIIANFTNAFVSVTNSTHVSVNKKDSGFYCYDKTAPEGTNVTIYVEFNYKDVTGNITAIFDGKKYSTTVDESSYVYEIILPALNIGNYKIPVVYSGDDKYNSNNKTINVNVEAKRNSILDIFAASVTEGDDAKINVILSDGAGGNVTVNINGKNYSSTIYNEGSIIIPGLSSGNYTANVYYSGDEWYNSANGSVVVRVIPKDVPKKNVTMEAHANPIRQGYDRATINVVLPSDAGGFVSINFNNANYSAEVIKGKASINTPYNIFSAGNYSIPVVYSGDGLYNGVNDSIVLEVIPWDAPYVDVDMNLSANPITEGETAIIDVILPSDASGTVYAYTGDRGYYATVIDGNASISIPGLAAGNYTISVSYWGSAIYASTDGLVNLTVNPKSVTPKENLTLVASTTPITVGQVAIVVVEGFENATGNASAAIGSEIYFAPINGGSAVFRIQDLVENTTALISYPGDDKYNNASTSVDIIVNPAPVTPKENLTLVASTTPISVGQVAIIVVEGFENATGNASARVGNGVYFAPINGGSAIFRIQDLVENTTALITYPGDDKYNNASTSVDIIVNPAPVTPKENLTLKASTTPITVGQVAIIVVEGFENATGNASARVGNGIYFASINGGIAVFRIQDLIANDTALISYPGDDKYNEASTSVDIIVNPVNTNITLSFTVNGNNVTLTADVSPSDLTGEVVFNVNGENYTAKIADSKATYVLANLEAGLYVANAIYAGNATHKSSQSNDVSFNINEDYVVITAPDVDKYYHGSERFVVTLTDSKGNPVTNASVSININGNDYTRVTDDKGVASMAINLNSGVYEVTTKYNASEVKSTVTIKATVSGENITKMFRNGTQYYATFYDTNGKTLANGTAVEFNINGVFYTRYTNEKGVARMNINLNPGEYIITAKNPNSTEMYTNIITVLPTIVENYDLTKYYKNASQYSLRLLDEKGNPVKAGVDVKLNINGVFYTRTSNADGYVKMNINLNPGEYIITAEYNGLMASNKIKVLSVIETDDLSMKYQDGSYFNATILDGQGKPLANANVTFNINGVFYNKVTDENGVARLKINLMAGEYIITTTYNGLNAANKITISS